MKKTRLIRRYFKNRILVQGQGGRKVRTGHLIRYFFMLASLLIFSACTTLQNDLIEKPSCFDPSSRQYLTEVEIRNLISAFQNRNGQLKSYKGIGKIRLLEQGKLSLSERIAWIGTDKDRIRIAMLVSGRPVVNIACDGKWLYYQDVESGKSTVKRKKYSNGSGLERLIKIPVSLNHIISLLTGRVPVSKYTTVECEPHDESNRVVLVLKRWRRIVEKIYLSEKPDRVDAVEMYDSSGSLLYRVSFEKMQHLNGYQVPSRFVISNYDAISLQLDIDKYMVDIPVEDAMFVLEPDKSEKQ